MPMLCIHKYSVYTNYMTNYMCIIVLHQIAAYTFCKCLGWDAMPPTDHTTIFQININSYFPLPMLQPSPRWLIPFHSEATFCHCGFFKQHRLQGMQLHYKDKFHSYTTHPDPDEGLWHCLVHLTNFWVACKLTCNMDEIHMNAAAD